MKRVVNGQEVILEPTSPGVSVVPLGDRLQVRTDQGSYSAAVVRRGDSVLVSYRGRVFEVTKPGAASRSASAVGSGEMRAPMPGAIVDVLVEPGQEVLKGERLVVLEAMKTHQPFTAPFDGVVADLPVTEGQQVAEGALLVRVVRKEG